MARVITGVIPAITPKFSAGNQVWGAVARMLIAAHPIRNHTDSDSSSANSRAPALVYNSLICLPRRSLARIIAD